MLLCSYHTSTNTDTRYKTVAAGADGLEVEVHYDPQHAWSDGAQCLTPDSFAQAMAKCRQVAWAIGRDM